MHSATDAESACCHGSCHDVITCNLQLHETLTFTPASDLVPTDGLETTLNDAVSGDDVSVASVAERSSDKAYNVKHVFLCDTTLYVDRVTLQH